MELEENLQKRLKLQKTSEEGRLPEGTQVIMHVIKNYQVA